jgi:hypothetical protein
VPLRPWLSSPSLNASTPPFSPADAGSPFSASLSRLSLQESFSHSGDVLPRMDTTAEICFQAAGMPPAPAPTDDGQGRGRENESLVVLVATDDGQGKTDGAAPDGAAEGGGGGAGAAGRGVAPAMEGAAADVAAWFGLARTTSGVQLHVQETAAARGPDARAMYRLYVTGAAGGLVGGDEQAVREAFRMSSAGSTWFTRLAFRAYVGSVYLYRPGSIYMPPHCRTWSIYIYIDIDI